MKLKINLLTILTGLGIITILACGGGEPYVPSIRSTGTTTGTTTGGTFAMSISPASTTVYGNASPPATKTMTVRSLTLGRSSHYTVTLTPSGGFNKTVNLSAQSPQSWMDASLDKSSVSLASGAQSATLTVTINNNWDGESGPYNVPVTASGGGKTVTKNAVVNVSDADYSINISPSSQQMTNGTSSKGGTRGITMPEDDFTVTVTPNNGFFGVVQLSVQNPNSAVFTATLDATSVDSENNNSASTTLRVRRNSVTSQTGDNIFTVNGTCYSINRSGSADVVLVNGTP